MPLPRSGFAGKENRKSVTPEGGLRDCFSQSCFSLSVWQCLKVPDFAKSRTMLVGYNLSPTANNEFEVQINESTSAVEQHAAFLFTTAPMHTTGSARRCCCGGHMQAGECADLSYDCLRSTGPDQWAIHVPLGKLKTERMVPVDSFVRDLVHRLRFFRSLDPLPVDGRLLAWVWNQDRSPCPASRVPAHGLPLRRSSPRYRSPPNEAYLRNGDASLWHGLRHRDEVTRPHPSRNDDALRRRDLDRSPARVSTGSFQTQTSSSSAKNPTHARAHRPRRPHRFLARYTTCTGNVPPIKAERWYSQSASQALQTPHQDPRRNKKTPNRLNENGHRLAG